METKDFIEKTNNIVKLLMRVAGDSDFTTAASITTAQAEMDCDTLLKHCDIVTDIIKKSKAELMGLKKNKSFRISLQRILKVLGNGLPPLKMELLNGERQ